MKTLKRTIAVLLTLILVSGSFVCFAADGEKQYHEYKKVMLLGDSEASGFTDYGDEMSEFTRVDDSYAAYVADDLGAEFLPMACPGFRTIELRCMLDDNYNPVDDPYLFTEVPRTPKDEILAKSPEMRQGIAESDLIIIGIGGNDWGAYLGWTLEDVQFANRLPEEFRTQLREFLEKATFEDDIIGKIIELADYLNALDDIAAVLPEAAYYAFSNLNKNWEYIIEYIYENNPDVTVVAVGMFPTYLKTEEGAPDVVSEPDAVSKLFEDAMIAYGNKHMIDNQEKYGYVYVDTTGTVVEICHPTKAGHRHIADRILEELPDARFSFSDVSIRAPYYKAAEYMYLNGYMNSIDETAFGADAKITMAELSEILNNVTGTYAVTDSADEVTKLNLSKALFNLSGDASFVDMFKFFVSAVKLVLSGNAFKTVTRAEVAVEIYNVIK
ncbi:MAG: hypothetical protein J6Q94_03425 [Clostridia bacterium]|nr:hypothetical protein [Clostridia bacterium]